MREIGRRASPGVHLHAAWAAEWRRHRRLKEKMQGFEAVAMTTRQQKSILF